MSEFNRSKNDRVTRMDKILEASQGKDEKELKEQDNPAAEGERAARADVAAAKAEEKPRAKVTKEMLQTHGKAVFRVLDEYYDAITRAQRILDRSVKGLPDDVRSAFALTQEDLDEFSDRIDDFIMDQGYEPGMIEVELENLELGAYDDEEN